MNDKNLMQVSIDLRRKLYNVLIEFFDNDKNQILSTEDIFRINSIVISSLLAQVSHAMFKNKNELDKMGDYIDDICKFAKEQLKIGIQYL